MIGNLKTLALALCAVFAMSAVTTSAASASVEFHPESPSGFTTFEPHTESVAIVNYGKMTCTNQVLHGLYNDDISTTEIRLNAILNECTGPLGIKAIVKMNGCELVFRAGETDASKNYEGLLDLECGVKPVEIEMESSGVLRCRVTIPGQLNLSKVTYVNTNVGKGKERTIKVEANITGASYTQHAGTGPGACKSESASNGTYTNLFVLTGETPSNFEQVGVWVE